MQGLGRWPIWAWGEGWEAAPTGVWMVCGEGLVPKRKIWWGDESAFLEKTVDWLCFRSIGGSKPFLGGLLGVPTSCCV